MDEYPISRMYRDQKIKEIREGTNEAQRLIIARQIGLWATNCNEIGLPRNRNGAVKNAVAVIALMISLAACGHASTSGVDRNATVLELADVIRTFVPAEQSQTSGIDWEAGATEDAPRAISWKTSGLQSSADRAYSFSRTAEVIVSLNGVVQTTLQNRVVPHPWIVTMFGAHCCVAQTTIDNDLLNGSWPAFAYLANHGFRYSITDCIGSATDRSALATLDIPGRKRVFIRVHTSCGASSPCGEAMDIRYNDEPHSRGDFPGDDYMTDHLQPSDCAKI